MFPASLNAQDRQQSVEKHYGKYPGVVLDNKPRDSDGHRGEVLVEVPGILEDRDSQHLPMQAWAKPCFPPGFFFVPEIGDHVWVEFAAGDVNFPIWTGVWYPKEKTPQTESGKAPIESQKIIRTIVGQVIQLDAKQDEERIVIHHGSGSTIEIDSAGKITITDVGNDTSFVSTKINLGTKGGASEPLVLGNALKSKLAELIGIIMAHDHPTGVGPSGPPLTKSVDLTKLQSSLQEILSRQNTTD